MSQLPKLYSPTHSCTFIFSVFTGAKFLYIFDAIFLAKYLLRLGCFHLCNSIVFVWHKQIQIGNWDFFSPIPQSKIRSQIKVSSFRETFSKFGLEIFSQVQQRYPGFTIAIVLFSYGMFKVQPKMDIFFSFSSFRLYIPVQSSKQHLIFQRHALFWQ